MPWRAKHSTASKSTDSHEPGLAVRLPLCFMWCSEMPTAMGTATITFGYMRRATCRATQVDEAISCSKGRCSRCCSMLPVGMIAAWNFPASSPWRNSRRV